MKKLLFITLITLLLFPVLTNAQDSDKKKGKSYTATNGITYQVGDTIKLNKGSMPNGDFKWLMMGGWYAITSYDSRKGSEQLNASKFHSMGNVVVKAIKQKRMKGSLQTYFVVGGGNITNYWLYIDEAIADCEIKNCKEEEHTTTTLQQPLSIADELSKLKKLKDDGLLNEEEFNKQKEKLLN